MLENLVIRLGLVRLEIGQCRFTGVESSFTISGGCLELIGVGCVSVMLRDKHLKRGECENADEVKGLCSRKCAKSCVQEIFSLPSPSLSLV
ncbi:hypothetical protein F2Q68_00025135 [Brassica cretica]|uniref:Uncharacterized protein n=1 Tax=Brassica cretica TaxID=69181 RepID=A0A8S9IFH8_BRACR|nr:hypothetical protein F2Q68_00025135 [Brassica cretica]